VFSANSLNKFFATFCLLAKYVTFMARFALVHFLHKAVQAYDPGPKVIFMHFLLQLPASYSYLGTFAGY